jgi:hypothetical protein
MTKQILALSFLFVGLQGVAHATFPSDAEANYNLPAVETYASRHADANGSQSWGVSKREAQSPFPSGGGYIDD